MGYSTTGAKPIEYASKAQHHYIINDETVKAAISEYWLPPPASKELIKDLTIPYQPVNDSPIKTILAVDGGFTDVAIRQDFPSSTCCFFQFGALLFKTKDLHELHTKEFISPEDMSTLKKIARVKLVVPTKGIRLKDSDSLRNSVRKVIYEFFKREKLNHSQGDSLLDTLAWFIFHRYKNEKDKTNHDRQWSLSRNPATNEPLDFVLKESEMSSGGTFKINGIDTPIYLTDVFRLHELVDDETGGSGISVYLASVIEHMLALHSIRFWMTKAGQMNQTLFIMDRPTGFFGQTANMHKPMNDLVCWLFDNMGLYWAGLEKSGSFVDHAREIQKSMDNGSVLILSDEYIFKYISPGNEDPKRPYAHTSYYGHKVIFKTPAGQMYVVSLPVRKLEKKPSKQDLKNLDVILTHIEQLKCDMYESALLPVALANKLVSLAAHPSSQILESFAKNNVG